MIPLIRTGFSCATATAWSALEKKGVKNPLLIKDGSDKSSFFVIWLIGWSSFTKIGVNHVLTSESSSLAWCVMMLLSQNDLNSGEWNIIICLDTCIGTNPGMKLAPQIWSFVCHQFWTLPHIAKSTRLENPIAILENHQVMFFSSYVLFVFFFSIISLVGGLEHFLFLHILGIIIPTDELTCFRGVGIQPPTSSTLYHESWIIFVNDKMTTHCSPWKNA